KSREIYHHSIECITTCLSKISEGTSTRRDIEELDRWISTLATFKERDYKAIEKSREEVGHTLMLARLIRFQLDQLHPVHYLRAKVVRH
ncbi:MAG TPA: hypothetical protein VEC36_09225, partial [Patescibacteria group bacterium]|nr:hypothetical protein [Patescibacteria group bacterium]